MGKSTDNQRASKATRDALLKDIVDTEHQASCALGFKRGKEQLIISPSYEEMVEIMKRGEGIVECQTFRWGGTRSATMMLFTVAYDVADLVEIVKITDDMWGDYITQQAARASQPQQGGSGLTVPQPHVPPGAFN